MGGVLLAIIEGVASLAPKMYQQFFEKVENGKKAAIFAIKLMKSHHFCIIPLAMHHKNAFLDSTNFIAGEASGDKKLAESKNAFLWCIASGIMQK